jgi:hypothetical protein
MGHVHAGLNVILENDSEITSKVRRCGVPHRRGARRNYRFNSRWAKEERVTLKEHTIRTPILPASPLKSTASAVRKDALNSRGFSP